MYAGEIVERGSLADVFDDHVHPYTAGLLGSIPDVENTGGRLTPIRGNVPTLLDHEMDDRCYFADRCPKAMEECLERPPDLPGPGSENHVAKCYLADHPYDPGAALPEGHFEGEEEAAGDD
jgi:peptide/nickel transport system ATP-binding protein